MKELAKFNKEAAESNCAKKTSFELAGQKVLSLTEKTNKNNVVPALRLKISSLALGGCVVTARTVKFHANEQNAKMAPVALKMYEWAKNNGFEMKARPVGKSEICNGVVHQWVSYTIK